MGAIRPTALGYSARRHGPGAFVSEIRGPDPLGPVPGNGSSRCDAVLHEPIPAQFVGSDPVEQEISSRPTSEKAGSPRSGGRSKYGEGIRIEARRPTT
jgi:hypothetical protein